MFSSKWSPPQEESKCENAQFLQWILKDDDVFFKKITASKILGNSFIVKCVGVLHSMLPPQYCVTGPRWVNLCKAFVKLIMIGCCNTPLYSIKPVKFDFVKDMSMVSSNELQYCHLKVALYWLLPYCFIHNFCILCPALQFNIVVFS